MTPPSSLVADAELQEPPPGPSKTGFLHDSYPPAAIVTPLGPSGPETRPVRYPHNKYLQSSH